MKKLLLFAAVVLSVAGCASHKEYDLSDGINTELTLFEKGITVPIGTIGPVTLSDLLGKMAGSPLLSALGSYLPSPDDEGYLSVTLEKEQMRSVNILEIDQKITDKDQEYVMDFGTSFAPVPLAATVLGAFGFVFPDQQATFYARQPMNVAVPVTGKAQMVGMDQQTYDEVLIAESDLDVATLARGSSDRTVASLAAPDGITLPASEIRLKNLQMTLPANAMDNLRTRSDVNFVLSASYRSHLAPGPGLTFSMSELSIPFSLPLGRFSLKKAIVSMDIVNTLPLRVKLDELQALQADGSVNPDIRIAGGIVIRGGARDLPAVSPVVLEIEATEGRIPDLSGLAITFEISAEPGLPATPIHVDQGITLKSASASIVGGITINRK